MNEIVRKCQIIKFIRENRETELFTEFNKNNPIKITEGSVFMSEGLPKYIKKGKKVETSSKGCYYDLYRIPAPQW